MPLFLNHTPKDETPFQTVDGKNLNWFEMIIIIRTGYKKLTWFEKCELIGK